MAYKLTHKIFLSLLIFAALNFDPLLANVRMGLSTASNYVGDREVAWRIKIAGEMLGWTVILDEKNGLNIKGMKDLDFVISLLPNNNAINPFCPNYQMIFHPFWYLDDHRQLLPFYEKYDGYLLTIKDRESIAKGFKAKHKEFYYIPFYPSVYSIPYCEVPLDSLVTMIPVWSDRYTDQKFRSLYRYLSDSHFTKFYGVNKNSDIISEGYMGAIPFDGVSVIKVLQQHGIVLIMHSEVHNSEGIPSGRIFEAAAASAVIISDNNPFVREHFGNSVFYIDTAASAEEIFSQISRHMATIFQNPDKAREMAKNAHQVFINKFEMTNQLLQLKALNRKILAKKKTHG